jgi:hypothetical protein
MAFSSTGTFYVSALSSQGRTFWLDRTLEAMMGGIIYLVGLIVIVLAILSFLGLR